MFVLLSGPSAGQYELGSSPKNDECMLSGLVLAHSLGVMFQALTRGRGFTLRHMMWDPEFCRSKFLRWASPRSRNLFGY